MDVQHSDLRVHRAPANDLEFLALILHQLVRVGCVCVCVFSLQRVQAVRSDA